MGELRHRFVLVDEIDDKISKFCTKIESPDYDSPFLQILADDQPDLLCWLSPEKQQITFEEAMVSLATSLSP
jgi:hypothetical protein